MSLINKTDLLRFIKEGLNKQSETDDWYMEMCIKLAAFDVSKKFNSLFHQELVLDSDSDGIITLPADTFAILSVQEGDREARAVNLRDAQIYSSRSIVFLDNLYSSVKQFEDRVELRLLPAQTYTDVYVLVQTINGFIGNLPIHRMGTIVRGARFWYVTTKQYTIDEDLSQQIKDLYDEEMNKLQLEENMLYPDTRFKFYWEASWERNFNYTPGDLTRDVY